ncbi:hypothetical protein [Halorussus lipolyticus]|uniref:hypothetical protein n=1 Tax=Halorussus lipolyticus TaxID=3034024 RepID=UPI0023E8BB0A|nr:hypothetical protein [Halorussus sp. DT80]
MELTWIVASSLLCAGFGYVFVRRAKQFRVVCWTLLGASLFALATRDLFRSRQQGRPSPTPREAPSRAPDRGDDERQRVALLKRLRRRLGSWLG